MTERIDLGITADFHVHLRDGKMMELIAPTVREGGISIAYVMPNLVPPITTIDRVVSYKRELEKLAPQTTFLMTFYLSKELTPELVEKAAREKAIQGIKCYPAGVTTNSSAGVDPNDFSDFYPIFETMQKNGLILNLHGEKPSSQDSAESIHVLNAEPKFLPALEKLHKDFPNLKIVLEHCSTESAIDLVEKLNEKVKSPTDVRVAASITAHHLSLTIDSWAGNPINFCKPVPKLPEDKKRIVQAATSGKPYFFFGSDSAPHPEASKARHTGACAGVYTQSFAIPYVTEVFEKENKLINLRKFVTENGKNFYGIKDDQVRSKDTVSIVAKENGVPEVFGNDEVTVVPFRAGQKLKWCVEWNKFN